MANYRDLRDRAGADVAAVLKADFYGLGAAPVAARLYAEGCRHVFVAQLAEAVALRDIVPDAMLAVLGGLLAGDEPIHAAKNIVPVLGSVDEIDRWAAHARAVGHELPALLHVDTGMNRLGLPPEEFFSLTETRLAGIDVLYVMTHLLDAERPDSAANARQLAAFTEAVAHRPGRASFANSSGLFLGDAFGSDLARPGAALAGINPAPGTAHPLRPVARLTARVLQLRTIPAGTAVGYRATWTAARDTRIATVGIGYADGWPVSLSNRGRASLDGCVLPLVGRVSMDLTLFDATGAPAIRAGDMVELIGPSIPVEQVAADAGTTPYEILTRLGRRIARTYHG